MVTAEFQWAQLPGTDYRFPADREFADRMVALAIARWNIPWARRVPFVLDGTFRDYLDALRDWLRKAPSDFAGYTRRAVLCQAAAAAGRSTNVKRLLAAADDDYQYVMQV
jgi:hypothetical protein